MYYSNQVEAYFNLFTSSQVKYMKRPCALRLNKEKYDGINRITIIHNFLLISCNRL